MNTLLNLLDRFEQATAQKRTYVRKIATGVFEYGWYRPAKNFRKQRDEYSPAGTCGTVADAEVAREALSKAEDHSNG